jgi:hypothetical protein
VLAKVQDCYRSLPPAEFPLFLAGISQPQAKDWGRIFDISIRMFVAGLFATYAPGTQKPAAQVETVTAG